MNFVKMNLKVLALVFFTIISCRSFNQLDDIENPDVWAPTNLTIIVNSENSVTITWEYEGSLDVDGFIIARK